VLVGGGQLYRAFPLSKASLTSSMDRGIGSFRRTRKLDLISPYVNEGKAMLYFKPSSLLTIFVNI
jgi:hypothetical protein